MDTPSKGLQDLLDRDAKARAFFDSLPPQLRTALNNQDISTFDMLKLWADGNYGVNAYFN